MRLNSVRARICAGVLGYSLMAIPSAHAVFVSIINDLQADERGAVIEVDRVKGFGVLPSLRVVIMPGETKKVTARNIFFFTVSRVYGDSREKFEVTCPNDRRIKDAISVTIKDLRSNRLEAGCQVTRHGQWTVTGGTTWDDEQAQADE